MMAFGRRRRRFRSYNGRYRRLLRRAYRSRGGAFGPRQLFSMDLTMARGPEKKWDDNGYGANCGIGTGAVPAGALLFSIAEGSGPNSRLGRLIHLKSFTARWLVQPGSAQITQEPSRLVLIYDRQTNGVMPNYSDIFTTDIVSGQINCMSNMNLNNRDRFLVILDKIFNLPGNTMPMYNGAGITNNVATFNQVGRIVRQKFRRVNLPVLFKGATNGVGDIASGGVYAIYLSNGTAGTTQPGITLNIRWRFHDG